MFDVQECNFPLNLIFKVKTTLKIIEEEKDHFQAKLTDEIKARRELEGKMSFSFV